MFASTSKSAPPPPHTPPRLSTAAYFWRIVRYRPGLFALNALLWGIMHSLPVLTGLLIRQIFDSLAEQQSAGLNAWTYLALLSLTSISRIAGFSGGFWVFTRYWHIINLWLKRNMLEWLLRAPGSRVLPDSPGEAVSRFRDDVEEITMLMEYSIDFSGFALFALLSLGVMLQTSPLLTVVVATPIVGMLVLTHALGSTIRRYRRRHRQATEQVTDFIGELFASVQAVRVAGAEAHMSAQLAQRNAERRRAALRDGLLSELLRSVNSNMVTIATGIILLLSAQQMRTGTFSVGDFALFVSYLPRLTDAMTYLGETFSQYKRSDVSFARLIRLMHDAPAEQLVDPRPLPLTVFSAEDMPVEAAPAEQVFAEGAFAENMPTVTRSSEIDADAPAFLRSVPDFGRLAQLELQHLSYQHPSSQQAAADTPGGIQAGIQGGIHDVSFRVPRGSFTVITGRIGSGKTTVLRTLLGLVPRDSGCILWNGHEVDDPASFFVPPRSAYTPQVPRLFSDSLADNILMNIPEAERAQILPEALRLAIMQHDVARLEHGIDSLVGTRGVKLSGGQVQRSAAARMFAQHSDLLIFDDLSSALDVHTEQLLWQQIFARGQATCLVVSHRRAALQRADHIIVMHEGRVIGQGRLETLLQDCAEMRRLWGEEG